MFCPKCGNQLPDGSKFCGVCGQRLVGKSHEESIIPVALTEKRIVAAETGIKTNIAKKLGASLVLIAVASVVVIAAIIGAISLFGKDDAYVFLSDGDYEFATNLKENKEIVFSSAKTDENKSNLVRFSPDGKYVYYYTKYNSETNTGSLNRVEFGKLKEKTNKNDKYIEIIDTNVSLDFRFVDESSIIYKKGENTLCYYNGEESTQIAKNVEYYFTNGLDKLIYSIGNEDEGKTLYGVNLDDIDNRIKLVSNYDSILGPFSNFDNILYTKIKDNGSKTLYVVGFEKKSEKIVDNIDSYGYIGDKWYFTAENGTTLNLYDFVEDNKAVLDERIKEPKEADYSIPEYKYKMVSGSNLSESNFTELYTTCVHDLYWYGISKYSCYSMEEAVNRSGKKVADATKIFISKYADRANSDGFIKVTEEVKAALQEIQKYADNPDRKWQWMWLCYDRYQSGTTTDWEAYYAAYDEWSAANKRMDLREGLKNTEYPVKTLYCFDNGTLTVINENILDVDMLYCDQGILFNTVEMVSEKVNIEDITYISDVAKIFYINWEDENNVILSNGNICKMSADAADTIGESHNKFGYVMLRFAENEVYLHEEDYTLSVAEINDGIVGDFTIIADDAVNSLLYDSTLYYWGNYYSRDDNEYVDLHSYKNGISNCLAKDHLFGCSNVYEDGAVIAVTDYKNYSGSELTLFNADGEPTVIGDNISQYIRVDKSTLLYISNDDLYCYDGKERSMIKNDVDWIWSKNCMNTLDAYMFSKSSVK